MNSNRILLAILIINSLLIYSVGIPCSSYVKDGDPTICLLLQLYEDRQEEYQKLIEEGTKNIASKVFPDRKDLYESFVSFDGVPYPIPIGASVYFLTFTAMIIVWYLTASSRHCLKKTKSKLLLHPETAKFPNLPLYWLQQSKREIILKREVRNTWAWLAKRYLLSPDDPLLEGIDEVMGLTTWEDFHVPRDTWSLLNVILRINQLYLKVQKDAAGRDSFAIVRDKSGNIHETVPSHLLPEQFDEEEHIEGVDSHPGVIIFASSTLARKSTKPSTEQLTPGGSDDEESSSYTDSTTRILSSSKPALTLESILVSEPSIHPEPLPTPEHQDRSSIEKKKVSTESKPESPQQHVSKHRRRKTKVLKKKPRSKPKYHKGKVFPEENPMEEYEPNYEAVPALDAADVPNAEHAVVPTATGKKDLLARYLEEQQPGAEENNKTSRKHRRRRRKEKGEGREKKERQVIETTEIREEWHTVKSRHKHPHRHRHHHHRRKNPEEGESSHRHHHHRGRSRPPSDAGSAIVVDFIKGSEKSSRVEYPSSTSRRPRRRSVQHLDNSTSATIYDRTHSAASSGGRRYPMNEEYQENAHSRHHADSARNLENYLDIRRKKSKSQSHKRRHYR